MSIRVHRNFRLRLSFSDRALMRQIGLLARERVIRRTLSGRDEDGAAFTPYSPSYAARKGKRRVNLQDTGEMLNSIAVLSTDRNSVEVGFKGGGALRKATFHQSSGRVIRRFFGLTRQDEDAIVTMVEDHIERHALGIR